MPSDLKPSQFRERYPYPRRQFVRQIIRGFIGVWLPILTRFRVVGGDDLPKDGPLIVVFNHFHFLDAVLMIRVMPWPLEFLADFEMPNVPPFLRWVPNLYGTFTVAQGSANRETIYASEAVLAQKGVLGIFPEGRLHQPPLHAALPGAAFLAMRTGALILPVGVYSDRDWDIFGTIRQTGHRLKVTCRFGEIIGPFTSDTPRRPSKEELDRVGRRIMTAIAGLLPAEMQGEFTPGKESEPFA